MNTHPQDFDFATDMMYIRGVGVTAVDLDDTARAIIERLREDGAIAKDTPLKHFRAEISNASVDTYYTRMDPKTTLRTFAKTVGGDKGVPILVNHGGGLFGGGGDPNNLPIGRSIDGVFRNEAVRSRFYIQQDIDEGVAVSKRIAGGSMTDVSVRTRGGEMRCEFCEEQMRGGFFFFGDSNGHYPGKQILVDKQGRETKDPKEAVRQERIIGRIENADISEYSPVWSGATPGAEIIEKARSLDRNGELTEDQINFISHRFNINMRHLMDANPTKSYSIPNHNRRQNMSTNIPEDQQVLIDELRDKGTRMQGEIDQLRAKIAELTPKAEAYDENLNNLEQAQEQVRTLETEVDTLKPLAKQGETAITTLREKAKAQRRRAKGNDEPEDKRIRGEERIERMTSVDALVDLLNEYEDEARDRYTPRKSIANSADAPTQTPQSSVDLAYRQGSY